MAYPAILTTLQDGDNGRPGHKVVACSLRQGEALAVKYDETMSLQANHDKACVAFIENQARDGANCHGLYVRGTTLCGFAYVKIGTCGDGMTRIGD